MKYALLLFVNLAMVVGNASGHEQHFSASFSGADASASGAAALTLSEDHSRLSYSISFLGLDLGGQTATTDDDVLGLHFHNAVAGENGPIVFGLLGSSALGDALNPTITDDIDDLMIDEAAGTVSGAWEITDSPSLTASMLDALNAQALYLNVHTESFRGGAIRGQIVPEPATSILLLVAAGTVASIWRKRRRAN